MLESGKPARLVEVSDEDAKAWKMLQLLTTKPVLYVCNVSEEEAAEGNEYSAKVAEMAAAQGNAHVIISAKIEEEISLLEEDEAEMFLFTCLFPVPVFNAPTNTTVEQKRETSVRVQGADHPHWLANSH
jgi:ribosome-binding ATPase YchF (GTP1/OBG family)